MNLQTPPPDLTKREYFAIVALHGLLINGAHRLQRDPSGGVTADGYLIEYKFTNVATVLADELIDRLNRTTNEEAQNHGS